MLITRADVRLVFSAGLATGFGAITAMPFNYYLGMTVLAVSTGSYSGVLGLGRQRLLGSLLGSLVLGVAWPGLQGLPMPLALAIALASLRLLGGLLRLQVGYKVGGMIVVMGWLVHGQQLGEWLPLRLFWTMLGIVVSLLSLRLFWPSSAVMLCWRALSELLDHLALGVQQQADRLRQPGIAVAADRKAHRRLITDLRNALASLRALRPQVREELGTLPQEHPSDRLIGRFETTCSRLIGVVQGLEAAGARTVHALPAAEADLLDAVAERLRLWQHALLLFDGRSQLLPPAPQELLHWPDPWRVLDPWSSAPVLDPWSPESLEQLAGRLVLCRQAQQLIEHTEAHWREDGDH
ncbi:MAG: FUSC family protein [Cyanobacteriota bacterium]